MVGKPILDVSWSRILIESSVIVVSILLAFGIDATWEARVDREREQAYLELLASDLRSTLANNQRFGPVADARDPALALLVRAFYESDLPETDSIVHWLDRGTGALTLQPRLGAAQSLVASGDLALIRSDSLKTAIRDYLTDMTFYDEANRDRQGDINEGRQELSELVDLLRVRLLVTEATVRASAAAADSLYPYPAGSIRPLPDLDAERIVRDPTIHTVLGRILQAKTQSRFWREQMRVRSERLLERVEAARN